MNAEATLERVLMIVERCRDLEREIAALKEEADAQPEKLRIMYRRGYLAGRSATRRGAPAVTNHKPRSLR